MNKLVHVAVGVIQKDGRILIARRPQQSHQGGLWEFPGGKLAPGETVHQALIRELREELAIEVIASAPLIQIRHDYGDKQVLLDVRSVTKFSGEPLGAEGQPITWVAIENLRDYAFPAANRPIITALLLPQKMLVTGSANSFDQYLEFTQSALQAGVGCVQLRCPDLPPADYLALANSIQQLCDAAGARLILNCSLEIFAASRATGLHLNRHQLASLRSRPVGVDALLGTSCHNAQELALAVEAGVDYVTLSPVAATSSHPYSTVLGWETFAELVAATPLPVFALGGMTEADINRACQLGAQGIAAVSCWWGKRYSSSGG